MAEFTRQISALVTEAQKTALAEMLAEDLIKWPGCHEADVIREALALGLPMLRQEPVEARVRAYIARKSGMSSRP